MATIVTPIGIRERMSLGEVGIPTYYGSLIPGDRAELIRRGYKPRATRKSQGIRANGDLVRILPSGYYAETRAPKS